MLLLAGVAALGVYVRSVIDVLDQPDRSPIFWHLVFVEAGGVLLVAGGFLVVLAVWTHRDPEFSAVFLGGTLLGLVILGAVGGVYVAVQEREADRARKKRAEARAVHQRLARTMHRLKRLKLVRFGEHGFTVEIAASGERTGTYHLTLLVSAGRTEFLRETERLALTPGDTVFRRRVAYRNLFRRCGTAADSSPRVPVCVNGAGARTFWTVRVRLRLENGALLGSAVNLDSGWNRSSNEVQMVMDTFTENGTVDVRQARPKP